MFAANSSNYEMLFRPNQSALHIGPQAASLGPLRRPLIWSLELVPWLL